MGQSVDLNRVRLFIEVAKAGNISRAAEKMGLRKSKVSRDLALLEESLDTQLVIRTTRQFQLTEAGRRLLQRAEGSILPLESFLGHLQDASTEVAGLVRLTCPEDVGQHLLVPALDQFRQLYPQVTLDLVFTSELVDLIDKRLDLGIRIGVLADSSMRQRKVGVVRRSIVCAPGIYDRLADDFQIEALKDAPIVSFHGDGLRPTWSLYRGEEGRRIELQPTISVNSYQALLDFVLKEHGIGLLPDFIAQHHLARGELVHVLRDWSPMPSPIQIVFPRHNKPSSRVKLLADFLLKTLKKHF